MAGLHKRQRPHIVEILQSGKTQARVNRAVNVDLAIVRKV